MESIFYVAIGINLMVVSAYIELRHKHIWGSCKPKQKLYQKNLIHYLTKPNMFSYLVNIYLIWPVVFVMGGLFLTIGVQLSEIKLW